MQFRQVWPDLRPRVEWLQQPAHLPGGCGTIVPRSTLSKEQPQTPGPGLHPVSRASLPWRRLWSSPQNLHSSRLQVRSWLGPSLSILVTEPKPAPLPPRAETTGVSLDRNQGGWPVLGAGRHLQPAKPCLKKAVFLEEAAAELLCPVPLSPLDVSSQSPAFLGWSSTSLHKCRPHLTEVRAGAPGLPHLRVQAPLQICPALLATAPSLLKCLWFSPEKLWSLFPPPPKPPSSPSITSGPQPAPYK